MNLRQLLSRVVALTCAGSLVWGCATEDDELGSNTNWWRSCVADVDCDPMLSCLCGVCTQACEDSCDGLDAASCVLPDESSYARICDKIKDAPQHGVCAVACSDHDDCSQGQACLDGVCLAVDVPACAGATNISFTDEAAGTSLDWSGREGSWLSDTLYLPQQFSAPPIDWDFTAGKRELELLISDAEGSAVADCEVAYFASGGGVATARQNPSDSAGLSRALWIAGAESEQLFTAVILDESGMAHSVSRRASVYPHDAGPQAAENATTTVRPSTVNLDFGFDSATDGLRSTVTPLSVGHHSLLSDIGIPSAFAALQNIGSSNSSESDIPAAERVYHIKIWNSAAGAAQVLQASSAFACTSDPSDDTYGSHTCRVEDAWQIDQASVTEFHWTLTANTETPTYFDQTTGSACAEPDGCLDYIFDLSGPALATPQRLIARIVGSNVPRSNSAFLQPFATTTSQTSCLRTPRYAAAFAWEELQGDQSTAVTELEAAPVYKGWNNEVCANVDLTTTATTYEVSTGGAELSGTTWLPGDSPLTLQLQP